MITEIYPDVRVWGDDGLEGMKLGEICISAGLKCIARTERKFLKVIIE